MKIFLTVLVSLMLLAGFSSVSWAVTVPFSQNTGFDTNPGTLLSDDSGSPQNDIRWNAAAVSLPGYSIIDPTSPKFNTIFWGVGNNNGGLKDYDWGTPVGNYFTDYSGLRVLGFAGDNTVGDWSTISRIYHQNSTISASFATLSSAIIRATLTVGTDDLNSIPFTFYETPNDGSHPGPGGLGDGPDEWAFNPVGFAPVSFTYGGIDYLAEFKFANLVNGTFVPNSETSWSLWTREGVTSSADVQMRLTEVPTVIPEPASLSLLGLGLLGLFFKGKKVRQ